MPSDTYTPEQMREDATWLESFGTVPSLVGVNTIALSRFAAMLRAGADAMVRLAEAERKNAVGYESIAQMAALLMKLKGTITRLRAVADTVERAVEAGAIDEVYLSAIRDALAAAKETPPC